MQNDLAGSTWLSCKINVASIVSVTIGLVDEAVNDQASERANQH